IIMQDNQAMKTAEQVEHVGVIVAIAHLIDKQIVWYCRVPLNQLVRTQNAVLDFPGDPHWRLRWIHDQFDFKAALERLEQLGGVVRDAGRARRQWRGEGEAPTTGADERMAPPSMAEIIK